MEVPQVQLEQVLDETAPHMIEGATDRMVASEQLNKAVTESTAQRTKDGDVLAINAKTVANADEQAAAEPETSSPQVVLQLILPKNTEEEKQSLFSWREDQRQRFRESIAVRRDGPPCKS